MIFKTTYKHLEFKEEGNLFDLSKRINSVPDSNLHSRAMDNKIFVYKKSLTDFFPFNIAHFASLSIHAVSKRIDDEQEQLKFSIEINSLSRTLYFLQLALLLFIILYSIFYSELAFAAVISVFTLISVLALNFFHKIGMRNFINNWDQYIGESI